MNIVLIGMPGVGKSTIGIVLAKTLGLDFIDTDICIQNHEKKLLQDIINEAGIDLFLQKEEKIVSNLDLNNSLIATGGSVVYSDVAMKNLKKNGLIIYLELDIEVIIKRINNIKTRGLVIKDGKTLYDVYNDRVPLYKKYQDFNVNCNGKYLEEIVEEIKNIYCKQKKIKDCTF